LAGVGFIFTSWRNFILYLVSNRYPCNLNSFKGYFSPFLKGKYMSQYKADAAYLYEHYKQSGQSLANTLYERLIKQNDLKLWEAEALKREFLKLLKGNV
jgi:hypothetical protein